MQLQCGAGRKTLKIEDFQLNLSITPTYRIEDAARFRTWFPLREWRFESSLRHLAQRTRENLGPFLLPFGWPVKETNHEAAALTPVVSGSSRDLWPGLGR